MAKKASERRFDKLVGELLELRTNHPERFRLVWRNYFRGWAQEVQRRAAAHRQDVADGPIRSIFGVLDKAQRLARGIDEVRIAGPGRQLVAVVTGFGGGQRYRFEAVSLSN